MRIIVTGSRTWEDWHLVFTALEEAIKGQKEVTVVHGACPKGADDHASQWCEGSAWYLDNEGVALHEERHAADWEKYGKPAGFIRNDKMAALGADLCLAFIKDGSKGASMMADLAEKAGIKTVRYTA